MEIRPPGGDRADKPERRCGGMLVWSRTPEELKSLALPTKTTQSRSSATTLHDFHGATRLVYLESPLLQRLPELVPADDFNPLAATLRELNSVRFLDAARSQA